MLRDAVGAVTRLFVVLAGIRTGAPNEAMVAQTLNFAAGATMKPFFLSVHVAHKEVPASVAFGVPRRHVFLRRPYRESNKMLKVA
jgi:hypothetical protein